MFERIFPRQFDNSYHGNRLAIWLLGLISAIKGLQGAVSVFDTRNVLTGADGIPLDRYGASGAETVIALMALLGFFQLVIALQSAVALIRYRAMVPLLLLLQLVVQSGGRLLLAVNPIARTSAEAVALAGRPVGFYINLTLLAMTLVGFGLSLQNRRAQSSVGSC